MRLSLVTTLRRNCAIVAALSAVVLTALPGHAQATAQPAKPASPKTTAAPAPPAKAPAAKATPAAATTQQPPAAQPAKPVAKPAPSPAAKPGVITPNRVYIDINHATLKELKNIPGIGDVYGKKIIAGRPYANKSQLVSRKIIDANLYDTIQGMIIAKQ